MADKPWVVGFYGPGDVNEQAVNDLLMDWLPEDAIMLIDPKTLAKTGLRVVRDWADEVKQDYQLVQPEDVILDLVTYSAQGHQVYLVLLWGEEGDKRAEDLLHDATTNNILVKDLTSALDDLQLDEPEVEEVPEPDDTTSLLGGDQGPSLPATVINFDAGNLTLTSPLPEVGLSLSAATQALTAALHSYVIAAVQETLLKNQEEEDLPLEDEELIPFYLDSKTGAYRKVGRGRMRKDEERVELTTSKVKELGLDA